MIDRVNWRMGAAMAGFLLLAGCEMPLEPEAAVTDAGTAPAAQPATGELIVTLSDPAWTGGAIPDGQQCTKFGAVAPMTPPLKVSGLPIGTLRVIVEFNDEDFQPLSYDGGHGKIDFEVGPGEAYLPAVPGETDQMPPGVRIAAKNRATGDFARPGYLPPCSGGRDHDYFAVVKAIGPTQEVLAEGRVDIGSY
ncbi:hypothetical protein L2U69_16185 [Zavarzinia compransoris]|uniref:hypothetical protein n=1 Tax=Zavarzinia marina TaxID=2911065 RepID=UPI001F32FA82|nr:hypothetical protein [Zavarzinia marina]MCF4167188.1 hypothetical protein [Zavarzinia marina]